MSITRLLAILGMIWVACVGLGLALHVIRFLVYVAIIATLGVAAVGALTRR